jgi:hypothetical protein
MPRARTARATRTATVYSTVEAHVGVPGTDYTVFLEVGQAWDARDPLVKARPDLFTANAPESTIRTSAPLSIPLVETATAEPGELRDLSLPVDEEEA